MSPEQAFPSRLLRFESGSALAGAAFDPRRINMHLEGRANGKRIMRDSEVQDLLGDPFATLVLRRERFPRNLTELLAELDGHNDTKEGLAEQASFLISEGGQIVFKPGTQKGGSRLLVVRSRAGSPELMISILTSPGESPRSEDLLLEVIAWDPENRTFHFYQRQKGAWFWCGQSDMAFDADTRSNGPFDSHINGYPNMKELKTPWVHWHGPGLAIQETAYAPDDPLATDDLFLSKQTAFTFEVRVVRPLMSRWNEARFDKAMAGGPLSPATLFLRQVVESTSVNLITTHTEFARLTQEDLEDVPVTFFLDLDSLIDSTGVGLPVDIPRLRMSGVTYSDLIKRHNLRVRGGSIDVAGDVPFCFLVPERAHEDVLVVLGMLARNHLSRRLAACLLMVDFPNPVFSPKRAGLLRHAPKGPLGAASDLDATFVDAIRAASATAGEDSAETEFIANWDLGPDDWQDAFADRMSAYLVAVAERLASSEGADEIFRLAESRRREFKRMPLAEFDLSLPVAMGIPEDTLPLEMREDATVVTRKES